MDPSDEYAAYQQQLLEDTYDCLDHIVVNTYFPLGQRCGGLRTRWRRWTGSEESLNKAHLQRMTVRKLCVYALQCEKFPSP